MIVLVTGAGRGLGRCLADHALESGHTVIATSRRLEDVSLPDRAGRLYGIELDVTDEASISQAAVDISEKFPVIDVVINNAGVLGSGGGQTIDHTDMRDVERIFDANTFGPMRVTKHFLPLLLLSKRPSLINISSDAGSITHASGGGSYGYAMSKGALNFFTQQMRAELRGRVQVLAVHPGWMKTDMGGDRAPVDPRTSAAGIFRLIESGIEAPDGRFAYVDYEGNWMPI